MRDGVIAFAGGAVSAATTREQFLQLHPGATLVTANEPHRTYRLGPIAVRGRAVYANLTFAGESLRTIRLGGVSEAASWDEVTERMLVADKQANDDWLRAEFGLGARASFRWGTIASTIDRRSGSSAITIAYDEDATVP